MALFRSLTRFLSTAAKPAPAVHLAAFGKHPGWNDHLDDLGLDTQPLVTAKRLLYVQGISQNIDSGAWDKLESADAAAGGGQSSGLAAIPRLDLFRHDFLWYMPEDGLPDYLAGRLWSSSDGKGRAKYPMVVCSHIVDLPDRFATHVVMPVLARVHEKCAAAASAQAVRDVIDSHREELRSHLKDALSLDSLTPAQLVAVARHPDMTGGDASVPLGFHRIVYQFARGMRRLPYPRPQSRRLAPPGTSAPSRLRHVFPRCLAVLPPLRPHVCRPFHPAFPHRPRPVPERLGPRRFRGGLHPGSTSSPASLPLPISFASRPAPSHFPSPPTFPTRLTLPSAVPLIPISPPATPSAVMLPFRHGRCSSDPTS